MARTSKNTTTSKNVKKGAKRGPYKKKNGFVAENGKIAEWIYEGAHTPEMPVAKKPEPAMSEIDFLAIFCDNFQQFDEETQQRTWQYLKSRYDKYFSL